MAPSNIVPTLSSSLLLAETLPNGSTGAQPVDLLYSFGVLAVIFAGGRQVFDSTFAENSEYVPPMPGSLPGPLGKLPFLGGQEAPEDPEAACEDLRVRLQEAAQAGDIETAFRLEKELKQLLAETGIRYIVDEGSENNEQLPKNW